LRPCSSDRFLAPRRGLTDCGRGGKRCEISELRQHPGRHDGARTNPNQTVILEMKSSTWHAEDALLLLMSGGFFVHLINASRHLRDDRSQVADILLRPVDLALFLLMAHCAVALIVRSRQFARTYDLTPIGRRLGYWAITAYVTVSLPGHVLFLLTGDTRFFDAFPWWFSFVIMPVYVLVVAYVLTLRPRQVAAPPVPRTSVGRPQGAKEQPVTRTPSAVGRQGGSK
jgi:hypothetical protein